MSEPAIRSQIASLLTAVTDIGKVYDYERWANDWATFINFFAVTIANKKQIRGWEIARVGAGESLQLLGLGSAATTGEHRYRLRGYLSVNDAAASEKDFNAVIERIRAAFRADMRLGGTADSHDYIQVALIDHRMFGSVLCHYAELLLTVTEDNEP